jgi:hypothetical protein
MSNYDYIIVQLWMDDSSQNSAKELIIITHY